MVALLIFMLGGLGVLYLILLTAIKNLEKPLAIPLLGLAIAVYMIAALLIGRYLPGLL